MAIKFYQMGVIEGMPSKLTIDSGEMTVSGLIETLCETYGTHVRDSMLTRGGELDGELMLVVNGSVLKRDGMLSSVIPDGSEVLLSVIVAGG